jgi:hypothetical protein
MHWKGKQEAVTNMAQMHPNRIDSDTKSNAECLLYETFRDDLDDSYTVFHSVAWQAIDVDGRPRDGEADFIIAHPDRGVLVLEAKGGSIRHDPRVGWGSIDHTGHAHLIKDPFAQSRDSKYVLLDLLKQMAG